MRAAHARQGSSEVDLFMHRVFDNRDASWRRLGDFILRETFTLELEAPTRIPVSGFRREYDWYVHDGVAVRSPVRFDGVDIDEETRRGSEAAWLGEERRRRLRGDSRPRAVTRREREENVAVAIDRSWGATVSERLRQRIAADADLLGDDAAAIALNAGAIFEELGDVEQVGFGTAVTRTRDLFVMLDMGRLTATEVGRALRRPLVGLVDRLDLAELHELDQLVELAERAAHVELDDRHLAPAVDRAARQLADQGRHELAARLEAIRSRLEAGASGGETGAGGGTVGTVLLDASRHELVNEEERFRWQEKV